MQPLRAEMGGSGPDVVGTQGGGRPEADCIVVIVGYNSADHIEPMLDSVFAASSGLAVRCVLADNASSDSTVELARLHPDVTVIDTGANLGYSGAINIAREHLGSAAAVLIANPDLTFEGDAIKRLFDAIAQPGVGIAVPMLRELDGELYPSLHREPSVLRALGDALFGARLAKRPAWLSGTIQDRRLYELDHDVEWASGAAMMISAACDRQVGRWDDSRFFLYSEETDYAARARRAGFRIRYVAQARAHHEEGGSGTSAALKALMAVNRVRYFEKYHHAPATWAFRTTMLLTYALRSWRAADRAALLALMQRARWRKLPGGIA